MTGKCQDCVHFEIFERHKHGAYAGCCTVTLPPWVTALLRHVERQVEKENGDVFVPDVNGNDSCDLWKRI